MFPALNSMTGRQTLKLQRRFLSCHCQFLVYALFAFFLFAHLSILHCRKRRTWIRGQLSAADYGAEELMTLIQRILTT
jgi:hypothetical protein